MRARLRRYRKVATLSIIVAILRACEVNFVDFCKVLHVFKKESVFFQFYRECLALYCARLCTKMRISVGNKCYIVTTVYRARRDIYRYIKICANNKNSVVWFARAKLQKMLEGGNEENRESSLQHRIGYPMDIRSVSISFYYFYEITQH